MRGRSLTILLAATVVVAWGYVGFQLWWRDGTCYDIQGDPDTIVRCDAYTRHIHAATGVALIISGAVVVLLLGVLVVALIRRQGLRA